MSPVPGSGFGHDTSHEGQEEQTQSSAHVVVVSGVAMEDDSELIDDSCLGP